MKSSETSPSRGSNYESSKIIFIIPGGANLVTKSGWLDDESKLTNGLDYIGIKMDHKSFEAVPPINPIIHVQRRGAMLGRIAKRH